MYTCGCLRLFFTFILYFYIYLFIYFIFDNITNLTPLLNIRGIENVTKYKQKLIFLGGLNININLYSEREKIQCELHVYSHILR